MNDCVGFGALNMDLIYEVDDLSAITVAGKACEAGAEMFCGPSDFEDLRRQLEDGALFRSQSPGGSAANTVVALSRMGFSTGYVGKVGQDAEGEILVKSMDGVDTSRVMRGGQSGFTVVLLDARRERTIIVLPNANDDITLDDVDIDYCRDGRFLHLTAFAGEKPTAAQIEIVRRVGKEIRICFDPGEIHTQKGLVKMLPVVKHCDVLFVTDREARLLTGEDYVDGTHELLNYGPNVVVCKLGAEGSYVLSKDEEFHVPPIEVEVVDRTGAGDVYAAGFIAGLLKGYDVMRCAKIANIAAAQSVTDWGRSAYPDATVLSQGA